MSWSRESSSKRGYGAAWRKIRLSALERDKHQCQICKANSIVKEAKEVDHILDKARGGTDELYNLQSLCKECHKDKTNNRDPSRGCDSNGMPLDPSHAWYR